MLKLRDRAPKFPLSEAFVVPSSGGSIGVTAKARVHRFDRGLRAEQRHRMDHLDTERSHWRPREVVGTAGDRQPNARAGRGPPTPPGAPRRTQKTGGSRGRRKRKK